MIGIVIKTNFHKMFVKMCDASKKCNLKPDKTNYAAYLGFYESEGLAGLMLLMFVRLLTDKI